MKTKTNTVFFTKSKISLLTLASVFCLSGGILTSCSTPAEKLENAKNDSIEADDDLEQANQDYLKEIEVYKKETADKIEANNKSIADFNVRIEKEKSEAKADYKAKIADLEAQNTDMKKTMEDYTAEGAEHWGVFKTEFSKDMDDLANAIKYLVTKEIK